MLALDAFFALSASGRLAYLKPKLNKGVAALLLAGLLVVPMDGFAQDQTDKTFDAATSLHLAYVKTGNGRIDDLSDAGLRSLSKALTQRTTIEPVGVRGVVPGQDSLVFYPFLYYPLERDTAALSPEAAADLNAYMAGGGTVVFDTQDAGDQAVLGGATHPGLARITKSLDIPGLASVPDDNVLTKSFYLLQVFPGRWANGTVWMDRDVNGAARDGVSSVIIGSNDWAAGWAMDDDGEPLATLERDIPNQREMSLRFGVNLAMYALAGSYKSDQVHAAALIERLGGQDRVPENMGDTNILVPPQEGPR